jgi:hypothetical protein
LANGDLLTSLYSNKCTIHAIKNTN